MSVIVEGEVDISTTLAAGSERPLAPLLHVNLAFEPVSHSSSPLPPPPYTPPPPLPPLVVFPLCCPLARPCLVLLAILLLDLL